MAVVESPVGARAEESSSINDAVGGASLYASLGVRRVINAAATYTMLGGSLMPASVRAAMMKAAECFVNINDLQAAVGRRIAALTHNEAALVTGGCAAALTQVTAALMVGTDPYLIRRLPDTTGLKNEVLIHRSQRNWYDQAVRTAGARLVEFGLPIDTKSYDLEGSISDRTVAVLYLAGSWFAPGALPLDETIRIAHGRGVPVVVDAAAQLPPVENLWRFTRDFGADVALFSGGKDLHGPQATGLVVGKREIVKATLLNGYPNHSVGRPMKIGKENIVGSLAAVEWYLGLDHEARRLDCEDQVAHLIRAMADLPGVIAERTPAGQSGEPLPRAIVRLEPGAARLDRDGLIAALRAGNPVIEVDPAPDGIYLNPSTLEPGEMASIAERLRELLWDG